MAIRMTGMVSGLDTDSIVKELVSAYSTKKEKYEKEQTKLGWKQEIWKDLNKEVNTFYKSVGNLRFAGGYSTKKTTSSDTTKATVSAGSNAVTGTQKLHVLSTAQSGYLTGGKITASDSSAKVTSSTKLSELGFTEDETALKFIAKDKDGKDISADIKLSKDSTISDAVKALRDVGLNASFDENNGRIFLSSSATGASTDFSLKSDGSDASKNLLNTLALNTDASEVTEASKRATKIDGSDAAIVLNGVVYTSSSNNFSINGLSISVNGVTDKVDDLKNVDVDALDDSKAVSISTTTDTQGIYDKIKDFLTSYNNIINKMTKLYNADSAKNYEPLTDDEKSEMSDSEIEKWETKIKDSLLRRDSTLSTVMSAMTTAMSGGATVNGKTYFLSNFGISTLGYMNAAENEQNAYHIDGDEDDENTSGNTDKLMTALNSDPDTVMDFMKQMATNLYNAIDKQMTSTTLRSKYSIYNDKEMTTQYKNYTTTIKEWETKISDKEDYYYKKFSSMESALSKFNSQTSSLSGLIGSN
ncbi:MAG: flagellar filament capping protein FliD [Lachnobacterium sp.]|nr:flagellar filament capping protein FliD [Lachnobacterium sp.]